MENESGFYEIENLEIVIDTETDKAVKGLDHLYKMLDKLDNKVKHTGLGKFCNHLKTIASADLSKTASDMERMAAAQEKLAALSKKGKQTVRSNRQSLPQTSAKATENIQTAQTAMPETVAKVAEAHASSATEAAHNLNREYANMNDTMEKTKEKAKDIGRSMSFMKAIKTILLYNVLFSALNAVTSGITEGLENVTHASKEANAVMTDYKATTLQMKNAIGSAAIPVLQMLYPLFQVTADTVIDTANAVNQLTSALQGKDTYLKAKADVDSYVESLQKAKGLLGMDEINTMSKSTSYGNMFEETQIDGWSVASTIADVAALTSGVLLLRAALKGFTWADMAKGATGFFGSFKTGYANVKTFTSSLPPLAKGLIGTGGVVYGFKLAADGGYDLAKALSSENREGLGSAILSLVSGGAMAVVGGAMIGGPIGALVGGLVAVGGALVGSAKAHKEYRYEMLQTAHYDVQGRKIAEVRDTLKSYFEALDFDKQENWIRKIEDTQKAYENATSAYGDMWDSIRNKATFDTSDIENLSAAFNELATAAKAVNNAKIGGLMASIKTGIEMNITSALTGQLGSLLDKIKEAKILLDGRFSGLSSEYQQILTDIANNGGVASAEQKAQLSAIRDRIDTFTLSTDTSATTWETEMKEALGTQINAGTDRESILANVLDLTGDRDTYLASLKEQYNRDLNTLRQLINLDKTEFGGALGFTEADEQSLYNAYMEKIGLINEQYNGVLQNIMDTYKAAMLDSDYIQEHVNNVTTSDNSLWGVISDFFGSFFHDGNGNTGHEADIINEYTESVNAFLEELERHIVAVPAYATGGFPEDGLFLANHTELIGKFAGGKTAVANNEQIIEGIARGVASASGEQNALLREQNRLLAEIAGKEAVAAVSVSTITRAQNRQSRRAGRSVVLTNG